MKVTQTCKTHIYHLKMANPLQKYNGNMVEKTNLPAWRKIIISLFCKPAEKGTLKIHDNTSTEEQRALKEARFSLHRITSL